MTRARLSTRPGFTLVELLVVVGLILVLLGLTLAVSTSGITDSYKTTSAADRVSGWLLIAKSKAQREKRPAGVRFIVGPNNQVREAQYIEVPDPYAPLPSTVGVLPRLLVVRVPAGPGVGERRRVFVADANIPDLSQSVFAGDMLSIPEFNTLHTIVLPPAGLVQFNPTTLTLGTGTITGFEVFVRNELLLPAVPVPNPTPAAGTLVPTYATTAFGFHRLPQPAIGEPTLQLTGDMIVDGPICQPAIGGLPGTSFDVLFAANGEVMNASGGRTVLWVRDVRLPTPRPNGLAGPDLRVDYEAAGQMALIVVYSKTGAIATQPVTLPQSASVAGHNPYSATTDAVNTGL